MDEVLVITDMDACLCQCGIVEGAESVEILGIDFGGTVAPHQLVLEEDAHFGDDRSTVRMLGGGYFNGGDEVLFLVGARVQMGSWEPVRMTGLERFSSMKLRAEAV